MGVEGVGEAASGSEGSDGEFCGIWGRLGRCRNSSTRMGTKMSRQRTAKIMETISMMVWPAGAAALKAQSLVGREPAREKQS